MAPDSVLVDISAWGRSTSPSRGRALDRVQPLHAADQLGRTPPFGPGLVPKAGPLGRLRDAVVRLLVTGAAKKTLTPKINARPRPAGGRRAARFAAAGGASAGADAVEALFSPARR